MKVKWHLDHPMQGADLRGEVELEDNATEDEIEHSVREDMWNFLSLTWERIA